jgi:phosphoglycerate dehydrogenase-like enzyme
LVTKNVERCDRNGGTFLEKSVNMSRHDKILVAIRPSLYQELFTPEMDTQLRKIGEVVHQTSEDNLTSAQLARQISGYDAVITGWGTPQFNDSVLTNADQLKVIVHSAGSIKRLLPPPVFEKGIHVSHVAAAMAPAVAELTLLFIMLSLRKIHTVDHAFKLSSWDSAKSIGMGHEIRGQRIGIIGAGYTGRYVINTLKSFDTDLWIYDPYLSSSKANALGVTKVDLETILRDCPIVTLQAPPTDDTYRMIGAEQFSMLQDGAIFINTARSHLVDESALLTELKSGRIIAALDVFEQEPLPDDSPFRSLDNVIITPHIAAATHQTRQRQGQITVDEMTRFFMDNTLQYEVTRAMLDIMA